jgi:hypothetical protein
MSLADDYMDLQNPLNIERERDINGLRMEKAATESMPGTLVYCQDGELHWGHYTPDEAADEETDTK